MNNEIAKVFDWTYGWYSERTIEWFSTDSENDEFDDNIMYEHLSNLNFKDDEIRSYISHSPTEEQMCKFVAFACYIEDDYNTAEELKELIYGYFDITVNDTNALQKILKYRHQLNKFGSYATMNLKDNSQHKSKLKTIVNKIMNILHCQK